MSSNARRDNAACYPQPACFSVSSPHSRLSPGAMARILIEDISGSDTKEGGPGVSTEDHQCRKMETPSSAGDVNTTRAANSSRPLYRRSGRLSLGDGLYSWALELWIGWIHASRLFPRRRASGGVPFKTSVSKLLKFFLICVMRGYEGHISERARVLASLVADRRPVRFSSLPEFDPVGLD